MKAKLSTLLLLSTLTALPLGAHSESACKGLDFDTCQLDESCRWIDSYTTQRGTVVKAYCRSQGRAKTSPAPSAAAPLPEAETAPASSTTPVTESVPTSGDQS